MLTVALMQYLPFTIYVFIYLQAILSSETIVIPNLRSILYFNMEWNGTTTINYKLQ